MYNIILGIKVAQALVLNLRFVIKTLSSLYYILNRKILFNFVLIKPYKDTADFMCSITFYQTAKALYCIYSGRHHTILLFKLYHNIENKYCKLDLYRDVHVFM